MNGKRWGKLLLIPVVALWGLGAQCGGNSTGPEIKFVDLSPIFIYTRIQKPVSDETSIYGDVLTFCFSLNAFDFGNAECWDIEDGEIIQTGPNKWKVDPMKTYTFSTQFYSWIYAFDLKMCEDRDESCSCLEGSIKVTFKESGWEAEHLVQDNISCELPNSLLKFRPINTK